VAPRTRFSTQSALRTLEWIGRRENLVVWGPAGTGKTFFLEALGQQASTPGCGSPGSPSKPSARAPGRRLGHQGDHPDPASRPRRGRRHRLLPAGPDAAEGFYRLVDAGYEKRSIAVSSNLHPSKAHMFTASCASQRLKFHGFGVVILPVVSRCPEGIASSVQPLRAPR
jgi:IstB-like ATP binding protein